MERERERKKEKGGERGVEKDISLIYVVVAGCQAVGWMLAQP